MIRTLVAVSAIGATFVMILAMDSQTVDAGPILFDHGSSAYQIDFYEPIGQSFVAEDPLVEAGLFFVAINPGRPEADPIRYQVFEGLGVDGPLVASASFTLSEPFTGFFLMDFSATPLVVGSTYTLAASIVGDSPLWAVWETLQAPPNTGTCQGITPCFEGEMALLVNPIAVPEPATWVLVGSCITGLLLRARWATPDVRRLRRGARYQVQRSVA